MARNPFDEENPQREIIGENIINNIRQKVVRISDQNGNIREVVIEAFSSIPGENGNFTDSDLQNVVTDHAGNSLPKDLDSIKISNNGLFISHSDDTDHCSSFLHFSPNRNILIGQDGRRTSRGAICSRCEFWLNSIYIFLAILGVGLVIGIYKGTGFF